MATVFTLYITKDSINEECYESVVNQRGVDQDLVVVSARKIDVPNNFVVEVSEAYPLPVRVGLSINRALAKYWDWRNYDYFLKIDGDVFIPPDFISDMIAKKKQIAGPGCAMLIEAVFFERHFGSRWAVCHCDDMYMKAYAFAKGKIEEVWEENLDSIKFDYDPPNSRRFVYGVEYYKFGTPAWYVMLVLIVSIVNRLRKLENRISVAGSINILGGYISALCTARYQWSKDYGGRITQLYYRKVLSLVARK